MRIIKDDNGEMVKGTKTPLLYENGENKFNYHLFVWLVDWQEATPEERYNYRYYISIRAASLDLQSQERKQRLIDSRADTLDPSDKWGMVCDLMTDGVSAVLYENEGDDRFRLLRLAAKEVNRFKSKKDWAELSQFTQMFAINQMKEA